MPSPRWPTATGLAAGYLADRVLGDPRRAHPVALFGRLAAGLEARGWADSRLRGVLYATVCVGASAALGVAVESSARRRPLGHAAAVATATWIVLGGRGLAAEGEAMARLLAAEDLPAARKRLGHLCGRDASGLDGSELARAATESIAENTSDAVVAPLFWGAVAGTPGLLGYRALNTLDAMVGHRTERHARFGWASARGDDVANLLPSRAAAALTAVCAPVVGGSTRAALRTWRHDGRRHPSPNAGQVEAAFAGALGVRLGGVNSYAGRPEDRGSLGSGPPPGVSGLRRSVRLSRAVGLAAASAAVLAAAFRENLR